jgi:hypothetical protein
LCEKGETVLTICANNAFVNQQEADAAETGLRITGVTTLEFGFVLFRFVGRADRTPISCASSPWWFQASAVRNILNDARQTQATISHSAQMNAAVAAAWKNSCQYILVAKVYYPLKCFYGPPRPVGKTSHKAAISGLPDKAHLQRNAFEAEGILIPDYSVGQFYIPGFNTLLRCGGESEEHAKARVAKLVRTSLKIRPQSRIGVIPGIDEGGVEGMLRAMSTL